MKLKIAVLAPMPRASDRIASALNVLLADIVRTPGVLNSDVTQANVRETICARGWTRTIRPPSDYTNALKAKQMRDYGVGGPPSNYQEDHLISL